MYTIIRYCNFVILLQRDVSMSYPNHLVSVYDNKKANFKPEIIGVLSFSGLLPDYSAPLPSTPTSSSPSPSPPPSPSPSPSSSPPLPRYSQLRFSSII